MRKAIAFTGPSNSGKTTLIEKIAKRLISSYKLAILKNDPSDKAKFDIEGKDSYKFFQTGAEVVVTSPTRTTYFSHRQKSLDEIIEMINDFDLLLVEGLKYLPLPRIGVFRGEIDESYFRYIKAVAIDDSVDRSKIPSNIEILDLNNIDEIIDWVLKNAIEV
ncbi:molybdopterin-guanine dinucleotide biosynthesis protein B [Caminibacter mediatlanticus TB-2]|uniref:Molybdopterin-guanine dinucleotide biosynthesis MobB region n=1 Tax=Caminibacter mediatlanticus TB-2 TaxID=391592 RepID=A0AAI9F1S5_9BACT|nr:molybdopterin-guanine dinucleotide biosynthesis protein B [Caminibacter mediatlanticus]EDM23058.1 Molybdopterin-guanine dinucleotide biosynthesis MobB region [Caminibacter mediatlanticus TB-2]QCT94574.1 molybdopterin-guanine dinucleotide biosynthesis protein B [Caminibacter mediatlanticus TB-2]